MAILLIIMLVMPISAILLAFLTRHPRISEYANLVASIGTLAVILPLPMLSRQGAHYYLSNYIIIDSLSAWVLLCVAIVYFLASIYAMGYMRMLNEERRLFYFYGLFAAFAWVMLVAPLMNDVAVYWIAIELTTLVSTFLISYVGAPESVEAAWKYIVIVSAGISLALLGIVFFYWGGTFIEGQTYHLTWSVLKTIAPQIHPVLLTLAFLLVLIGFGTKVGLAPMHTWLPDAHSEGPAPVSAMLSGALLNVAMLGVIRFLAILNNTPIKETMSFAMITLGMISLFIAALFIVKQNDVKRLMAYSSVEHMGVLALGFGFGGVFGIAGAFYHMFNHSLNKSLMFFGAGNAMHIYHTKDMSQINHVARSLPFTGGVWLAGAVAITGAPPFALFLSEFTILRGGMNSSNTWAVFLMAILLIVIFCGFLSHFWRMFFINSDAPVSRHPAISRWCILPMVIALIPLTILGLWWPHDLWNYFINIATQLGI